jgi:hypothetical protein
VLWDNVFHVMDMYSMAMVACIFFSVFSMIFAYAGYQFYSNFCSLFFLVFEVINQSFQVVTYIFDFMPLKILKHMPIYIIYYCVFSNGTL